ncbi:hypothetical protein JOC54_004029 [Alkalihalobacillus xiaoxiensis]|uniref:Uncharacterized protein n=1 Tax=Shouchella xiaoxiensis TaxID=766895 RepID=A0ABS2SZV4_9BACI|nr:hypothetical protein [Shouchella xiaoxiensis]MBM7840736.1 hypothetical protein [Shouchella xiaoxiensis]
MMSSFLTLIVVLLLTFSYKLVSVLVQMFDKKGLHERQRDATIYLWALLVFGGAFVYSYDTVFAWPSTIERIVPILLVGAFVNLLYSRYSGYEPSGKKNILHFVILFPIIEEMLFRAPRMDFIIILTGVYLTIALKKPGKPLFQRNAVDRVHLLIFLMVLALSVVNSTFVQLISNGVMILLAIAVVAPLIVVFINRSQTAS